MNLGTYVQFMLALLFVLGLILGLAWLMRRFGPGGLAAGMRGRGERRLAVVETLQLDAKRRMVLIRRDDTTEHLLLVGGETDRVIETGIAAPDRTGFTRALARSTEDGYSTGHSTGHSTKDTDA